MRDKLIRLKDRFAKVPNLREASKLKLGLIAVPTVFVLVILYSVSGALLAPGTDPVSARLAEWGRDHYLGFIVSALENAQYSVNKPKVGGSLDMSSKKLLAQDLSPTAVSIPSIVTPALPGEGDLKTVVANNGVPVIQIGFLRPDSTHTSYLTGVAIMNSSQLKFVAHPGFAEPGHVSQYGVDDQLKGADLSGLVATFNSAFKIKDSLGGYYQNGITARPLVDGKASLVTYNDGHVDIGNWGSEVSMTPDVASVRQNLNLLIDSGVETPDLDKSVLAKWGWTVKNAYYVWRSGIGVDAQGNVIYVAGNSMSVQSLADVLHAAGAVRAMELDINAEWISYMWYENSKTDTGLISHKLVAFDRPATRYFSPSSRDFYAVYLKN